MELEYAKNPVWTNADHTMIDLTIKWDAIDEELPFTASPDDCEEHGRALFAAAQAGEYGEVAQYIAPIPEPLTKEEQQARRAEAYMLEADPLFFKSQRGEATTQEWQAKVQEIKDRFPYPESD